MPNQVDIVIKTISEQAASAIEEIAAKLAAAFSVERLIEYTVHAAEAIEQSAKMAAAIGESIEQFSQLQFSAHMSSLGLQEIGQAMRFFTKQIAEAANPGSRSGMIFQALGIDPAGKDTIAVLGAVMDKFAGYKDGAEKAALAQELFGRGSMQMIAWLNKGSAGLRENAELANALGYTLGTDVAGKGELVANTWKLLTAAMEGAARVIITTVGPAIAELTVGVAELTRVLPALVGLWANFWAGLATNDLQGGARAGARSLAQSLHDIREIQAAYDKLRKELDQPAAAGHAGEGQGKPTAPNVNALEQAKALAKVKAEDELKIQQAYDALGEGALKARYERQQITTTHYYQWVREFIAREAADEETIIKRAAANGTPIEQEKARARIEELHANTARRLQDLESEQARARDKDLTRELDLRQRNLKVEEDELQIKQAEAQADWRATSWEKSEKEVQLLQQRQTLYDREIADLQRKKQLTDDNLTKEMLENRILEMRDRKRSTEMDLKKLQGQANPFSFADQMTLKLVQMREAWTSWAYQTANLITNTVTAAVNGLSNALTGVIMGTQSAGAAFAQFGMQMATQFIASVLQMVFTALIAMPIMAALSTLSGGTIAAEGGVTTTTAVASTLSSVMGMAHAAHGGLITGPGTGTSDSIPARLSTGEYVMQAAAVKHWGVPMMESLNARRFADGGYVGCFAGGGLVPPLAGGGAVNVAPAPVHVYYVKNERELLELMASHKGQKVVLGGVMKSKGQLGIRS